MHLGAAEEYKGSIHMQHLKLSFSPPAHIDPTHTMSNSSNGNPTVAVKLFVDREKKKVMFAESDQEFVDVLFSFLTLPLGTIVCLLGKRSQIGCLDELYSSVEDLSAHHFRTEACRTMLLRPINSAAVYCDGLKLKVDGGINSRPVYVCKSINCRSFAFSSVPDAVCKCGNVVECCSSEWTKEESSVGKQEEDGVFVVSGQKFIITDDLHVAPASTSLVFSLMEKFGLQEQDDVEEKMLQVDSNMMKSLLARALLTKQPLTGLCFDAAIVPDALNLCDLPEDLIKASDSESELKGIKIRIVQAKDDSSVLYAEVGTDFVDLVFGLLSIPLGSIIGAYAHCPPNGCIENLYKSIEGCVKQEVQSLLLSPKLAPFFGCSSNVIQVEEVAPRDLDLIDCFMCLKSKFHGHECCNITHLTSYKKTSYPNHISNLCTLREFDPKSPKEASGSVADAYIKGGPRNFMVTNDLRILHFSFVNTLQVVRAAKVPQEKLVEKELTLDKPQVLKLLRVAMVTREALTSVLLPPKKKQHHMYYPGSLV